MLRIRVSFDEKNEKDEALRVAEEIAEMLRGRGYRVWLTRRIYWNRRKGSGGRIYMTVLKPGRRSSARARRSVAQQR